MAGDKAPRSWRDPDSRASALGFGEHSGAASAAEAVAGGEVPDKFCKPLFEILFALSGR